MKPLYEPKGKAKEYAVYIHTFPNGKKYVGISSNIKNRFRNGRGYDGQPVMMAAIKKYGWDSVSTEIVATGLPELEAKNREIVLISQYRTAEHEYGYNQTLGGEGANGRSVSAENRKKTGERMSRIHKGVPLTEEHKKRISNALKGKAKPYSPEGKKRIIESNRTRIYSRETREKMSRNTKAAMQKNNIGEYLSQKWAEEKETRKAKVRVTMYDRYGVIPKNHNLRDDVILLGLDKTYYAELFA